MVRFRLREARLWQSRAPASTQIACCSAHRQLQLPPMGHLVQESEVHLQSSVQLWPEESRA